VTDLSPARIHRALEPLHALGYFAPESDEALTATGLRPGRMTYFAGRAGVMGSVGPAVVTATFYNFSPDLVDRYIPRAWTLADPAALYPARLRAAGQALRRLLGDDVAASEQIEMAATLARTATEAARPEGRPLFAAYADVDWPTTPLLTLWHAITLLREHRGDGHVAALVGHDLSGVEAIITHTATGYGFTEPAAKKLRGWSEEQWAAAADGLRDRRILDAAGDLTEAGRALRADVERATDAMAAAPWRHLGAERSERLTDITKPLCRAVAGAGAFPAGVFARG